MVQLTHHGATLRLCSLESLLSIQAVPCPAAHQCCQDTSWGLVVLTKLFLVGISAPGLTCILSPNYWCTGWTFSSLPCNHTKVSYLPYNYFTFFLNGAWVHSEDTADIHVLNCTYRIATPREEHFITQSTRCFNSVLWAAWHTMPSPWKNTLSYIRSVKRIHSQ